MAGRASYPGAVALTGGRGPVLILDFHNYALPLDPDSLLLWHQRSAESDDTAPVVLRAFKLSALPPLEGSLEELCDAMRGANAPLMAATTPVCELAIPTTVVGRRQRLAFPPPLRHVDELLILCGSSAIEPSSSADRGNLALLIARPREESYALYPQDWFNDAGLDYSYQWVTRVARNPESGRIHGDGVRISPFVLDHTLRWTL